MTFEVPKECYLLPSDHLVKEITEWLLARAALREDQRWFPAHMSGDNMRELKLQQIYTSSGP